MMKFSIPWISSGVHLLVFVALSLCQSEVAPFDYTDVNRMNIKQIFSQTFISDFHTFCLINIYVPMKGKDFIYSHSSIISWLDIYYC